MSAVIRTAEELYWSVSRFFPFLGFFLGKHDPHHARMLLLFDTSIRSGCVPFFKLVCSASRPEPKRSRFSRPSATACSSAAVLALQVEAPAGTWASLYRTVGGPPLFDFISATP